MDLVQTMTRASSCLLARHLGFREVNITRVKGVGEKMWLI